MTFGQAIAHLKQGGSGEYKVTRKTWYGSVAAPIMLLQKPDLNSKMTEPYLYMEKNHMNPHMKINEQPRKIRFPLDLSCESVLAEDWELVI